ncbi:uncharacterized protein LOC141689898 isoform X1 [Apium graveolens]|uniref:uncharacterized protein LOC141689898 isoform X1 n=1 Tax=Apium graveolens TaxID=4045 RepID=UPI003D7B58AE
MDGYERKECRGFCQRNRCQCCCHCCGRKGEGQGHRSRKGLRNELWVLLSDGQAEKARAHGPEEKNLATAMKHERKKEAEQHKQDKIEYNAASKNAAKEAAQHKKEKGGAI